MTAEFAAAMPAVILVLACCLAAIQLAGSQSRLQDAAAIAARSIARAAGSADPVIALMNSLVPGAAVQTESQGDLICVRLSMPGTVGGLSVVMLSARSCALGVG